jgi:hypothetical protein
MKNRMIITALSFFALITMSTSAFAHSSMEHSPVSHSFIHLVITAGVILAIIATAYYLYRSLPKVKHLRIKK